MKKILTTMLAGTMLLSFTACGGGEKNVSLNGSTSMEKVIGALSEQFMADNSGTNVTYDGTGSGTGIEAVKNGTADIGLSSRALKDTETADGLVGTTVALDGIAIIVNANSPVADLTVEQIAGLFTGEIADWSEVGRNRRRGGTDRPRSRLRHPRRF